MAQAEMLPFQGIVDYLKQLCAQGRSGTVFLVSDDNRMAQVRLDNGQIASLLCRNLRGLEAVGILRGMRHARLRFDESFMAKGENDHLSNHAIFEQLFAEGPATPAATPAASAGRAAPAVPATAAAAAAPAPALLLTPHVKATIERVMTQYIGPMAQIICEDHFDAAGNMHALMQLLAGEISAPQQAAKFRLEIARELGLPA
ncbi:MAG: hypothetical protein JWR40_5198 [Massilia sp.]|nr:hypothetical protein [Massilia sp.]